MKAGIEDKRPMHSLSGPRSGGYTLVVCEKPDAARKISDALSDGRAKVSMDGGTAVYRFSFGSEDFVVCAVQGHAYAVSDPFRERVVYPVFDAEWYPAALVEEGLASTGRRTEVIRRLARGASRFVNACDFDVEGETIGFNVLRYACGGAEAKALRARFSTLTREDLVTAFREARAQPHDGLARAGRARHFMDFVWGVNLSRFLSQSALAEGRSYRTVSIGRVQGPTLSFLVERESEIRSFVPAPFWKLSAVFEKSGVRFQGALSKQKVARRAEADRIVAECTGGHGVVAVSKRTLVKLPPPPPFNTGDLQKEAYRMFGLPPSRTLHLAEKLYLSGLISYPRTGSQKLPAAIGCARILMGLAQLPQFARFAGEALARGTKPVEGTKSDPAHPAIYPTGERPGGKLSSPEGKVYDMVVRRFLAAFGSNATQEVGDVGVDVHGSRFVVSGTRTVSVGWMACYGRHTGEGRLRFPQMEKGDRVNVVAVESEERFDDPPPRYDQGTLLEKMEREGIGTKATRAETISTLVERGYASGAALEATDLGFSVVETLQRHAPSIVSTGLTRATEESLQAIESGAADDRSFLRETVKTVSSQLVGLTANEAAVGAELGEAAAGESLGPCPICKAGRLVVVRSRRTKKRFVGCTGYSTGCRASAPLPQRGAIRTTGKACPACSWPTVSVVKGRRPWRFCLNMECPLRRGEKHEVRPV